MWGRKKKAVKLDFENSTDIKKLVDRLISEIPFPYIKKEQVFCVRSSGSSARAYARIWGLSRIFQEAAGYKPTYVIEVLSKYFDKLPEEEKVKVLIHELLHIPKTFSGALLSHRGRSHRIDRRVVERWFQNLRK